MKRIELHVDAIQYQNTKSSINTEAKRLNNYLDQLLSRVPDLKLNREQVVSFIVGSKIDYEIINELVFQTLLNKNPKVAELNLSREKTMLILDHPNLEKLDQYLQVGTLIQNTQYWKLKNNQVELNSGWEDQLKDACIIYADTELELERLKIAEQIKELTLKFYNTIEPEKQPLFDFESSLFYGSAEQLVIDFEFIVNGVPFQRINRFVLDYADQTNINNTKKDEYNNALKQAYKNLNK